MLSSHKNVAGGEREAEKEKVKPCRDNLWNLDDDEKLSEAVEIYTDPARIKRKRVDWDSVSKYMDVTRTPKQCYSRWTTTAMHNLDGRKVGAWDREDDAKLVEEVEKQMRNNNMKVSWEAVSKNANLQRNRKQCMARYNNVLQFQTCTTKKVGVWDAAEDTKLIEAVEMFRGKGRKNGVSWGDVVEQLNYTRSQKQCKKRWDDAFADVYKNRVATAAASVAATSKSSVNVEPINDFRYEGGSSYGNYCSNPAPCDSSFNCRGSSTGSSTGNSTCRSSSTNNDTKAFKQEDSIQKNEKEEKEGDGQWRNSSILRPEEKEEHVLAAGSLLNLSRVEDSGGM